MRRLLVRYFAAVLCVIAVAAMASLAQPRGLVDDENGRSETQTDPAPPADIDVELQPKDPKYWGDSRVAVGLGVDLSRGINFVNGTNNSSETEPETYIAPEPAESESEPSESEPEPQAIAAEVATETIRTNRYASIVDTISDDERDMLVRLVYHESRGIGGECVMEVVLNRMLDDEFPSTATDVVYQRNQFSPASGLYTWPINEPDAYALCQDVVDRVLSPDYEPELPSYYLYFNSIGPNSDDYVWRGGNVFYGYA